MKKQLMPAFAACAGMLVLILDGQTALAGAAEGIDLCIRTLIPSLFPFFIFSILLTGSLAGQSIRFLRPIGSLCGIPEGAESLLIIGFLGGYPTGAQNISLACQNGQLSPPDGERMLAFCNNAGPAFLFGVLGSMFSRSRTLWMLWGVHILSAVLVGFIIPRSSKSPASIGKSDPVTATTALERSVKTMALVCGWVVLFRILLTFLQRWILWALPEAAGVVLSGLLELSNGCVQLRSIESEGLRFLIAGAILAFGGCCVTLQTASVSKGLSLRLYFLGKLLQCSLSLLLGSILQFLFPPEARCIVSPVHFFLILSGTLFFIAILRKYEKISSIPAPVGV